MSTASDPVFATTPAVGLKPPPRPTTPLISVVVPVFNECRLIGQLIEALQQTLPTLSPRWEIVVVDDGSTDASASAALAAARSPEVRVVRFSRNFGKEAAMTAGLALARGDLVQIMDADLQHPVELLPRFFERWREGFDMVYGVRADIVSESGFKRAARRVFHRFIGREDRVEIPEGAGDFRLLDRRVVDALNRFPERERMMKGLFALLGFRQIALPFLPVERAEGSSHFNTMRLLRLAATGVTSFSSLPLQIFGVLGAFISVVAFLYAAWIIFEALVLGQDIGGFPTLAAGIMIFGGLQMLSVAALGAYVSRIYREVKGRPLYIIDRVYEGPSAQHPPLDGP